MPQSKETLLELYSQAHVRHTSLIESLEGTELTEFDVETIKMRKLLATWFFIRYLYSSAPSVAAEKKVMCVQRALFTCYTRRNTLFKE